MNFISLRILWYSLFFSSAFFQFTVSFIPSNIASRSLNRVGATETAAANSASVQRFPLSSGSGNSSIGDGRSAFAAADSCWSEWDAWSSYSSHCPQTTVSVSSYTVTDTLTSVVYETFKLCDGHPRAKAAGGERTSTGTVTRGFTTAQSYSLSIYTTVLPPSGVPISTAITTDTGVVKLTDKECITSKPTPKCTVGSRECVPLFRAWTAGNFSRSMPPCDEGLNDIPCDNCILYIPSVRLMYFPVSMTGNFCGNYSAATETPTGAPPVPTTVVVSGTTFTSGSAYLSYAGITATAFNGKTCGPVKPAGVLALPSSEVFSYRGRVPALAIAGDVHLSFDFGDLAPNPVPWDAWISQPTCVGHAQFHYCQTITQAAYRPGIVYPSQFWSMDPAWSKCGSEAFGIMDPPTALALIGQVATPNAPNIPTATAPSASPQVTPSLNIPHPTPEHPSQTGDRGILQSKTHTLLDHTSSNVISIPTPVQTGASDPSVNFTFADQTFTAYSGGVLDAPKMTLVVPESKAITLDGHTMNFASGGVRLDSQTLSFETTTSPLATASSTTNVHGRPLGRMVDVVYAHGSSRTTLEGVLNSNGRTIIPVGSSSFTFSGQKVVENSITFSAVQTMKAKSHSGSSDESSTATFLPSITSEHQASSASLVRPSMSPSNIYSASTTTSGSNTVVSKRSSSASLGVVLSLLMLAVI